MHSQHFVLPEVHPLTDGYEVVGCTHCGFVYADTLVTQKDYDVFYTRYSKYEDIQTSTGGGDASWDLQRLKDAAATIAKQLRHNEAKILDIGCANGGLLKALREIGYRNVYGVDPSEACVRHMLKVHQINAAKGTLFDMDLTALIPDQQFDCLVLSHVLEHISELQPAVDVLKPILKPGGILYVEVPDATRYKDYVFAPFQDFNTEHINHFSLRSLDNLLLPKGWEVVAEAQKVIYSAPKMPYPAIYKILKPSAAPNCDYAIAKDEGLLNDMCEYIIRSRFVMNRLDAQLAKIVKAGHDVIVWGTGQLAMKLLAETSLKNAKIVAFVDGNPINQGKMLRGISILSPSQAQTMPFPIVVTSILHGDEIMVHIREKLGMRNEIILLS